MINTIKKIQMNSIITKFLRLTSSFSKLKSIMSKEANSPQIVKQSPLKDFCKTPTDRPFKVSIEGNIGAGKSTLIKYFNNTKDIEVYPEPIEWWRNLNGCNLLDLMYSNTAEWLKVFQSYVQLTRLKLQTSKPHSTSTTVQIFERSIQNNRFCFVEVAYRNGSLSGPDFAVLDQWYQWLAANVNIDLDLIVYLKSTPEVVYERMRARGRPEEQRVPLEYLIQLHEAHESWLMSGDGFFNNIPVLVLDADQTLDDIEEQYRLNERKILGFEKKQARMVSKEEKESVRRNLDMDLTG